MKKIKSFAAPILQRIFLLYFCDWSSDVLDWVLSAIGDLTLSVGGSSSGPRRPPLDLNLPAAEAESAPPSDPRALEEENLRLRQENEELQRTLTEQKEQIQRVLDEAERHIQEVQEQDQARQQAWYAYREKMYREYQRLQALERENARMRFRVNELRFKKKGPPSW